MRISSVLCLLATVACGNQVRNDLAGDGPQLPSDALTVAGLGVTSANSDFLTQAMDPSVVADLEEFEDDGCLQDVTSPSPLEANTTTYTITRTYSNCGNGQLSATTGTRTVTVNNTNDTQATLTSALNLSMEQNDGSVVTLTSNTNVTLDGNASVGSVQRTYTTTGTWNDPDNPDSVGGTVQNFNDTLTFTDTYSTTTLLPTQSTINGTYSTTYVDIGQAYTVTYSNVVIQLSACCIPTGGTITEIQNSGEGSSQTNTWAFTSTCGVFTLNGQSATLNGCP